MRDAFKATQISAPDPQHEFIFAMGASDLDSKPHRKKCRDPFTAGFKALLQGGQLYSNRPGSSYIP